VQGAYQVRIVGPDDHVSTRAVRMGDRVGNRWIVEHGLQPNERIVVEGAQVRDGARVNPQPWVPPAPASAAQ
jgi:hypothetical protein